jgi:hypothetical protein
MKLIELISCDIYRDGGSIEGVWLTDEKDEWSIALKVKPWNTSTDTREYTLHQGKLAEVERHPRIEKGSYQQKEIMRMISDWSSSETDSASSNNRFDSLWAELKKGNY